MATAAATGVGIALPLIASGSAQAASVGTWDRVAVCETGAQWGANTGDGFFGGLAMTQDTWNQYGGGAYAERPDLATKDQQIAVAQKVLADLGAGAWPGCEVATGLIVDHRTPSIDTDATPVPDPSGPTGIQPSGTPAPTSSPTASPSPTATATGSGTPADGGTSAASGTSTGGGTPSAAPTAPGATATDTPAPVVPPGQIDGAPVTGTSQATPSPSGSGSPGARPGTPSTGSGRHGKPYDPTREELAAQDQETRTEVFSTTGSDATVNPVNPTNTSTVDKSGVSGSSGTSDSSGSASSSSDIGTQEGVDTYTVGAGDSLSGIASARHVDGGWRQLYAANRQLVGDDPNLIKPGQIISLG
ncbi:LysM peptidoglycan-binding domain-containing protein [Actinacidiphila yeochonensis]|uniref:LysM peptidoglycan-binding domain-containing protein n=1 Tax=Actinacidiphila yeochonensis TaxID=89050 RepID=UPI0018E32DA7|nr:transglycosylase family protein [Actinacidiphila yeochonensis]